MLPLPRVGFDTIWRGDSVYVDMICPFCHDRVHEGQELVLENEHCLFLQQAQRVLTGSPDVAYAGG